MTTLLGIRKTAITAATLTALMVLSAHRHASAEVISIIANLSTPTATENSFDTTVTVLGSSDTQVITYEGVVRPVLDIDFSNFAAPVVQTLDFAGVTGDILHSDVTFTVPLGTAVFTGLRGRIETLPGSLSAPVAGGTTYNSADHELIAWMGTIDINSSIGSIPQINLMTSTFQRSLGGVNDATVNLTLNNVVAGIATYDLELFTPIQMVTILTGDPLIDNAITITITGNVVARAQITRAIPEPTASVLFAGVTMLVAMCRRCLFFPRDSDQ